MNDKKLLELAIKAANAHGMQIVETSETFELVDAETDCDWNPLENDSDALRLAVNLRLSIGQHTKSNAVCAGIHTIPVHVTETEGNPYAATRRAIVRAAAEIGKAQGDASETA